MIDIVDLIFQGPGAMERTIHREKQCGVVRHLREYDTNEYTERMRKIGKGQHESALSLGANFFLSEGDGRCKHLFLRSHGDEANVFPSEVACCGFTLFGNDTLELISQAESKKFAPRLRASAKLS